MVIVSGWVGTLTSTSAVVFPSYTGRVINEYLGKVNCGNSDVKLVLCPWLADSYPPQASRTMETEINTAATSNITHASNFTFTLETHAHEASSLLTYLRTTRRFHCTHNTCISRGTG